MRRFRLYFILYILIICFSNVLAQSKLQSGIDRVLDSRELSHTSVSITVLDLESGEMLASVRPKKSLTPASSLKVITSLTALDVLGEEYQYSTKVGYEGSLDVDGTLKGDLIIYGSGDPTLGSTKFPGHPNFEQVLDEIIGAVKKAGISCIEGNIIADESIFNSFPISPSWQWNDLGNYYASGAWGININENQYTIYFDGRTVVGRRPRLKSYYPAVPDLSFSNELAVDSAGTGDNAYIFGGPYNYTKRIVGTIPAGEGVFSIKGSIPDPPYFLAYHVFKELERSKIAAEGFKVNFDLSKKIPERTIIHEFRSPALADIVKRNNLESNNLYSEALLKTLGLKVRRTGSGQLGISAIKRYLRKLDVDYGGLNMEDGSGLSARNYVTSYTLAEFLRKYALKNGIDQATLYLPRGGVSGTIRSMFAKSEASGKIWAKSGSMKDIMSYTGYVKAKSGQWRSFSIMFNAYNVHNKTIRTKMEKLMKEIYFSS